MASHLTLDQAIVGSSPTSSVSVVFVLVFVLVDGWLLPDEHDHAHEHGASWSHRLVVRTPASHVGSTGSSPVGTIFLLSTLSASICFFETPGLDSLFPPGLEWSYVV